MNGFTATAQTKYWHSHRLGKKFWQCYASKRVRYLEGLLTSSKVYSFFFNFISLLGLMIKLLPIDAIPCCKYRFAVQPGWSNQEGQERKIFLLLSWGTAWQRSKKKSGSIFCYHNDEKVQAKYDPTLKVQLSIPQSPPGISRERASLLPILFTSHPTALHPPPNPQ